METFYVVTVTEQGEWSPTLASGRGDWVESVPVLQVEEEEDGADHPRESEDKVFHQSLGCGKYDTVDRPLSNIPKSRASMRFRKYLCTKGSRKVNSAFCTLQAKILLPIVE